MMGDDPDLLRAVFTLSLDAIVIMDGDGILTGWNPAAQDLLGWSPDEAIGRSAADLLIPPIYREAHEEGLRQFRETGRGQVLGRVLDHMEARHRDGRQFPVELRISEPGQGADGKRIFVAYLRDISARRRDLRLHDVRHRLTRVISRATSWDGALGDLLQTLAPALDMAAAEAWLLDEGATQLAWGGGWSLPDVDFSAFTEGARAMTFRHGVGVPGRVWARGGPVAVLDVEEDPRLVRSEAARRYGLRSSLSFPLTTDDRVVGVITLYGCVDTVDAPLLDALGDVGKQLGQLLQRTRVEAALRDAQEHRRAGLEYRVFHDGLTGLPNRSLFDDRLEEALAIAVREKRSLALLLLDLDGFKEVNDRHGHLNGDAVLRQTAERLRNVLRRADTVARFGGDEFAVIPYGRFDDSSMGRLAAKIARALLAPMHVEGGTVTIRASIGGALYPRDGRVAQSLVRDADAAMYHAKRNGLGFVSYAAGMADDRGGSGTVAASDDPAGCDPVDADESAAIADDAP